MEFSTNTMSATVRRSIEVLGLCAVGLIIVLGQDVIMPLLMAGFISLLLLPLFRWLTKHKVPEVIAAVLCIFAFIAVLAGIVTFLSFQIAALVKDIDAIQKNLMVHLNNISGWINSKLHYTAEQQITIVQKQASKLGGNVAGYVQGAAVSLSGIFIFVGLIPIYIFLLLFYRKLILRFALMWFERDKCERVMEAVHETEVIVQYYLVGLLIQIAYLTVLVGGILMLFGIKHAILIGITFAILNLIPYIGALVGNVIGVVLTLTSSQDLSQIWIVLGTIAAVQFLDNNILMPRIVGSKVNVNALASIVSIVIGGTMAGVSGMFLSIPVMAVLRIMFEKTDHMKQWGILLGEARPDDKKKGGGKKPMLGMKQQLEKERDKELIKAAHNPD